ncbi:hypothetical protein [Phaeodactylibacter xiamenensis]|uniref:hypothetical protein n=1 Tax=Phaeodactylibacter xiamenensis TaxID=1524460 RepID=UPI003CCC0F9E
MEEYLVTYYFANQQFVGMSIKVTDADVIKDIVRVVQPANAFGAIERGAFDRNQPHRNSLVTPPTDQLKASEDNFFRRLRNSGGLNRMLRSNNLQINCLGQQLQGCFSFNQNPLPAPAIQSLGIQPLSIPPAELGVQVQPVIPLQDHQQIDPIRIGGIRPTPGDEIDLVKINDGVIPYFPDSNGNTRSPTDGSFPGRALFRNLVDAVNDNPSISRISLGGTSYGGTAPDAQTRVRLNRALNNIRSELMGMGIDVPVDVKLSDIHAGRSPNSNSINVKVE